MRPPPTPAMPPAAAMSAHFGSRMKYWRRLREHTQVQLARDLGVDGSYISKLESSRRQPNSDIAQRCDELLDTGGELAGLLALMANEEAPTPPENSVAVPIVWSPPHKSPGLDASAARPRIGAHNIAPLSSLLDAYVEIDCTMGGSHILAAVEQQTQELIGLQVGASQPTSAALLGLAAKFARLAGGLRHDSGEANGALFWYDCGQRWAQAAGENTLLAELGARSAIIHGRSGDQSAAVTVAQSAENIEPNNPNVVIWSRLAVARALSMAGDAAGVITQLDSAATLLCGDIAELAAPPAHVGNDYVFVSFAASCHLDLAAHAVSHAIEAVRLLRQSIELLPAHHVRELADIRLRLARALRCHGDVTEAELELTKVEAIAPRCTSPRLHWILDSERTALRSGH